MKTKILIAVLSIGLFAASTVKAQETKQVQIKHEQMGVTYTCPMHADVKSDKPGICPKCGMELKKMEMDSTKMDMKHNPMMMDHSKMDMKMDSTKTGMNHDQMAKTYVCPMHPEVISDKPGKCPKCGMTMVAKKMDTKMDMKKAEDTPENKSELKKHKH
ncbi:MAG: hypothetical protein GZ086_11960 [Gelidibacter sp.]|nr:hypothetical protein [Gelidibacter sp.]